MEQTCHRCHHSLSRDTAFCPECGAPQLNFDGTAAQEFPENDPAANPADRPGHVNWRIALDACARIALPAGILSALVPSGILLWVVGGATAVIFFYRQKRPTVSISARNGFRIGSMAGFAIAYVASAVTAILGVVQRYSMHMGDSIDRAYEEGIARSAELLQSSPEAQEQMKSFFRFMLTPDGRATSSFGGLAMLAGVTVLLAAIGGAIGVRLFAPKRVS
jgi:hypothetical protein